MEATFRARVAALLEERLAARFLGRTLDEPTLQEVADYIDGLRSRISFNEVMGVIVERDEQDPTRVTVHFPPQIEWIELAATLQV